ncbi:oxygen-sensitive ribonucleoside-triphosphate reductase [Candidatus Vecturithrix granuli]|uniref:Oxygen-sensitive ribonucleoside-triphosphate reductase n=1 Tax=Vecturithrix granuli TaxID=1499967 RepID=A0A081BUI5_VECG1|nr:oxygen-sensitive ribonucleoside-triphosphate reductase [Candidatus Vecturithrix granuli]
MNTTTLLVITIIVGVTVYLVAKFLKKGGATRLSCPACGKSYGGNPAKCPHCGEKLRWKN